MEAEMIDLIYEAAFVPELWTRLLERLAQLSGSVGSTLFLFDDDGPGRGVTLGNLRDLLGEFLANDDLRFSTSVVRMCDAKPHSFVEVDDYLSAAEIEHDPIRIRLRARGIGAHICTAIPMPSGELAIYVLQKALEVAHYEPEVVDRLNALRPHLARTGLIAAKLGIERASGTVTALETLGLATAVCSNGRVLAANPMFLAHPALFRIAAQDRLMVANTPANALLQTALHEHAVDDGHQIRSIPLTSDADIGPGVLHVLPLRRSASDVMSGGDALVVFTAVRASQLVPEPSVLSGLFDLSPAEAKLAIRLAAGQPLKDAASASDIKFSTARSYLEQIFRKTGTNQQSQLVALLKSASVIR
jgi:DNA-binding CsgD family transcriptional regulator